jgi:hypothetical protein
MIFFTMSPLIHQLFFERKVDERNFFSYQFFLVSVENQNFNLNGGTVSGMAVLMKRVIRMAERSSHVFCF